MADTPAFPVRNGTTLTLTALAVADPGSTGLTFTAGMTRLLTAEGGTTVAPGAAAQVALPGGSGGVILCDAGSLLPVAGLILDLSVTPQAGLSPGTADTDAMGHALDLVRNVMAAPSSKLAADLAEALGEAAKADDDAAADAIMEAFFRGHPPYETVTQDRYAMMLSWVSRYAYLWGLGADGRLGRAYDLQPSPYFGVNGTSLGRIAFAAPAGRAEVADPGDASSGLTIAFTPAGGTARDAAFADRGLTDGQGLALAGTFVDPSWVAGGGDGSRLVPVFAGQLDGKTVIAVPASGEGTDSDAKEGLSGLDVANLVIGIIGLISSFVTIWGGIYAFKSYVANKRARGQDLSRREKSLARKTANEVMDAIEETYGEQLRRIGSKAKPTRSSVELIREGKGQRSSSGEVLRKVAKAKLEKSFDDSETELEDLSGILNSPDLGEAASNLFEGRRKIDSDPLGASKDLRSSLDILKGVVKSSGKALSERQRRESEESLEEIEMETRVSERIEKEKVRDVEEGEEKDFEEGFSSAEEK